MSGTIYNISQVDSINEMISLEELSDIGDIIREMIKIRKTNSSFIKKTLSYSIDDKIMHNQISINLAHLIVENHLNNYDVVNTAFENLNDIDLIIKQDVFEYYRNIYFDEISNMKLSYTDNDSIRKFSTEIYKKINTRVINEIFKGKSSTIPENKQVTYVFSITAYVFYHCKFLIPIE